MSDSSAKMSSHYLWNCTEKCGHSILSRDKIISSCLCSSGATVALSFRILLPSLCDDGIKFFRALRKSLSSIWKIKRLKSSPALGLV